MKHPIQPLEKDAQGVLRFKENKIISRLIDDGIVSLNTIATWNASKEDRQQFAQLSGYSLSGYSDLYYVDAVAYESAVKVSQGEDPRDARINALESLLSEVRKGMKEGVAMLYERHPDDFVE